MRLNPRAFVFTAFIIALLLIFSAFFFLKGYRVGMQEGYQAAREQVAPYFPTPTQSATTLNATIVEVRTDAIVIGSVSASANPLDQQGPRERTVTVTGETAVSEITPKTSAQIAQAEKAYQGAIAAGKSATPPTPFAVAPLKLEDLKPGDRVRVSANEDIYLSSTFTATTVERLK